MAGEINKISNEEVYRLVEAEKSISPLLSSNFMSTPPLRLDFSRNNPDMHRINVMDASVLERYVTDSLQKAGRTWGCGGYDENRFFYESSELFKKGNEYRTIHLGLDVWVPAGTPIYAPLAGKIHSFQNNDHFLDYGPTIILEHMLGGVQFYSLYGHLSKTSLEDLAVGKTIESGEQIATVGTNKENGSWAPHLHFQLMTNLLGKTGDFPGTAAPSEREYYLSICPDPEILLGRFLKK